MTTERVGTWTSRAPRGVPGCIGTRPVYREAERAARGGRRRQPAEPPRAPSDLRRPRRRRAGEVRRARMRAVKPRRGHGWWPYLTPIFSFLLLGEFGGRLGEAAGAWLLPLRVAVPAALLATFYARGAYPELRTAPPGGALG